METQTKTPVQIVQELIAIHTNRIEMIQKCEGKALSPEAASRFVSARQESETYIAQLLNELSEFGDAVSASIDNENEYQTLYRKVLGQLDSMTPEEAEQTFESLEEALSHIYQTILQTGIELPSSLQKIISRQA